MQNKVAKRNRAKKASKKSVSKGADVDSNISKTSRRKLPQSAKVSSSTRRSKQAISSKKNRLDKKTFTFTDKVDLSFLVKSASFAILLIVAIVGIQIFSLSPSAEVKGEVSYATARSNTLYLKAPEQANIGQNIEVEIWASTNRPVDAVQSNLLHSAGLKYIKMSDNAHNDFDLDAPVIIGDGVVKIAKGKMNEPLNDVSRIGVVSFKAIDVGEARITFDKDSKIVSSKDNTDILQSIKPVTIIIQ